MARLPSIDALDDGSFHQRHTLLLWVLGAHLPLILVFGLAQGHALATAVVETIVPAACLVVALLATGRRARALLVAGGLVASSTAFVYLSGGSIEARFHVFVVVALVALYHDAATLAWTFAATVVAYAVGIALDADAVFSHQAAQDTPLAWAAIHVGAILAACAAVVLAWRVADGERARATQRAAATAQADASVARAEAVQRQTVADLLVHLARRNQALLDRQLELIAELEQQESTPEALADLFRLDHLATRIRRNAESLLVLSGEDPPRRWGRPVPLGEVVRAAAAEVEDYERVEALVNDQLDVTGRAVADMAHLLAELIENATTYSTPGSEVRVRTHVSSAEHATYVLSIEDTGTGMTAEAMDAANRMLADPPPLDLARAALGFQVVARLAKRYRLQVHLTATPGGGLTALVTLPDELVTERPGGAPAGLRPAPDSVPAGVAGAGVAGVAGPPPAPMRPGPGLEEWRLPDAETLGRMVAPTPPAARRSGRVGRGLRGMAIPRIGAEEMPPGPQAPQVGPPAPPAPPGAQGHIGPPPPAGTVRAQRLARRVPGEGLRSLPGSDEAGPEGRRTGREPAIDVDRMRTMLSKLQSTQRAGRPAPGGGGQVAGAGAPPAGAPPDDGA